MADISNEFIKDSFDYVLQSDLSTGVVYRLGGEVPINPIFQSGLTINDVFTYSDGSEYNGFVLTSDANGNASWKPVSGTSSGFDTYVTGGTYSDGVITFTNNSGNTFTVTGLYSGYTDNGQYLFLSGGTLTGSLYGTSISATTISGGTFYGNGSGITGLTQQQINIALGYTPYNSTNPNGYISGYTDTFVTGGTYNNGTATFINNTGGTFTVSGFVTNSSLGNYLPLSGGTMSGGIVANSGLTANTISQTQYIDFTTGSTNPSAVGGRIFFDNYSKSLSYYDIQGNNVPIAMGQQLYIRVHNSTGVQIDKGKVISITGTTNGLPSAILAINNHSITSARPIGLAAESIPSNSDGLVITNGILSGITLNTFNNGDTLYLSPTIPGGYESTTSTFPYTARTNEIGYVIETGTTTGKIYVTINNEDSNLTLTDIERNIFEGNVVSTGTYEYTGMTQGTGQTINIAPLKGWVIKNTYSYAIQPDVVHILYSGGTNIPLTYLSTAPATYILINSGSTVTQQVTFPTPQERRENIFIGKVVHPNNTTITSLNQTVDFDVSPMSALRDLWTPLKLINQGVTVSPHSTTLEINTSSGTLWGNGIGWTTNQLNPDSVYITGQSPVTFQYRSRLGSITGSTGLPAAPTGNTTTIDAHHYDSNGSIVAVGGNNKATNQRVYLFPTGLIRIQYGQVSYSSMANAIAGLDTETFVEFSNNRDNGILIGILTVREDAKDLSDTGDAQFKFVSKFGELFGGSAGISTTTLQQAYDNSSTPEIVINSTLDGLTIKNGTGNADSITHLIEGQNSSGVVTSFIMADGTFSGSTIITPSFRTNANGITATTISATTYQNLPLDIRVTGATYSNNTFTFINNTGGTFNVSFNTLSGLTINGVLSATTISGGTIYGNGSNLTGLTQSQITNALGYTPYNSTNPNGYITGYTDTYISGGTYSNGTLNLKNNLGSSFNVTGFTTGTTAVGSTNSIQFNNNGSFSGTTGLTWDGSILNNNGEYRLTTPDTYYSRLQRSTTGNTTYLKAQVLQAGGAGYGLSTNGTSYWTAPSTGLPSGSGVTFSISLWVFVRSTGFAGTIISYGSTSGNFICLYSFGGANYKIDFNGGNKALSSTLSVNQWFHFVITSDGSNVIVYQNGSIAGTSAGTASFAQSLNITSGLLQSTSSNGVSNYIYDQVLFYNTALNGSDVTALYTQSSVPKTGNLLRRYDWEQNANDSIGGYTASLVSSPTYVVGKTLIPSTIVESTPIQYQDGVYSGETGTLYLGDISSGTYLQGLSIKSFISGTGTYPFIIGTNGKVYINSSNTSTVSTLLGLSDLSVVGGVAIGTYATTNAAPSGGLIVSGNVGINQNTPTEKLHISSGNILLDTTQTIKWGTQIGVTGNAAGAGYALIQFQPLPSNTTGLFRVMPKGTSSNNIWNVTGIGGLFDVFSTDYTADASNYNRLMVVAGSNRNAFISDGQGSKTPLPFVWSTNAATTTDIMSLTSKGNLLLGTTTDTNGMFCVNQPTTSNGTVSGTSGGTTLTGTNTQFTNTFKVGDTITVIGTGGATYTISAIASDTSMTVGTLSANYSGAGYTLTGGSRFNVYGNGNISFGGNTGTIGGPSTKMWWDATNSALNIGTSITSAGYILNVNGNANFSTSVATNGFLAGNGMFRVSATDMKTSNVGILKFSSTSDSNLGPFDVTISRVGTNTLGIGNGTGTTAGILSIGKLLMFSGTTGTVTLTGGTVTISNTNVLSSSLIFLTCKTIGGTQGLLSYTSSAGTFTINSSLNTDTSTVNWWIIN